MDSKNYRWLTRREADTLAEAGATVWWRYNSVRFAVRPSEEQMTPWREWISSRELSVAEAIDGYDDQFKVEVE